VFGNENQENWLTSPACVSAKHVPGGFYSQTAVYFKEALPKSYTRVQAGAVL